MPGGLYNPILYCQHTQKNCCFLFGVNYNTKAQTLECQINLFLVYVFFLLIIFVKYKFSHSTQKLHFFTIILIIFCNILWIWMNNWFTYPHKTHWIIVSVIYCVIIVLTNNPMYWTLIIYRELWNEKTLNHSFIYRWLYICF